MANTFKSFPSKNIGTSAATVYTTPAATVSTIIGFTVSNTTASTISVDIFITRSSVDYYILKGCQIPSGGAEVVVGGDQKVVLMAGDAVKVVSNTATSADAFLSLLEIN